jgi:hypothetical protein
MCVAASHVPKRYEDVDAAANRERQTNRMNIDDLYDLMVKAEEAVKASGAKPVIKLNPVAEAWALEMERRGLLTRLEDGMFDGKRMFELWQEQGGFNG